MDGSAVVTTRLSSTTMKSAIETIAKVHMGRVRVMEVSIHSHRESVKTSGSGNAPS